MSNKLKVGTKIKSVYGSEITVEQHLGEGGQGDVYRVSYNGEPKALKWYKKQAFGDKPEALYKIIKENIDKGAPSKEFLWPTDITEYLNGTFGYIMDLRPEGYYEVSEFLLTNVRFKSFTTFVDAALNIANAFRILHNSGYVYQDINDGNFFINPKTGEVMICDNDNVAPENSETRILGKAGYMAPEVVVGKSSPNKLTDRYSLSVVLFTLLCLNHPLEGKRSLCPALDKNKERKLYGSEALFIMDNDNKANAPDPAIHANVLSVWGYLPDYIQELFHQSFSQESLLKSPSKRPKENDWIENLVRFRSEIIPCSCGNENFANNGVIPACDACGKQPDPYVCLQFNKKLVPAVANTRIYRCQLDTCKPEDALKSCAVIVAKIDDPKKIKLQSRDDDSWLCTTTKGESKTVKKKELVPLLPGIVIDTNKGIFKIVKQTSSEIK